MSAATDAAARELAEAVRERYTQPNGTVVAPRMTWPGDRRFWAALAVWEQVRRQPAEPVTDVVMTYRLTVRTAFGDVVYSTVPVTRAEAVPDVEGIARSLIGRRLMNLPNAPVGVPNPLAVVTAVRVDTWVGPFRDDKQMLVHQRELRTARRAGERT